MIEKYNYREVKPDDLAFICKFPQDENELYFMYPKAEYPLDVHQLQSSIKSRFDSTVILSEKVVVGFANIYEVKMGQCCSIGNVIVNPLFREKGVGIFLINTMESIAIKKYDVKEVHISCFNINVTGLLLYNKLGYLPYEMEKRFDKNLVPIALIKMKKEMNTGHLLNTYK